MIRTILLICLWAACSPAQSQTPYKLKLKKHIAPAALCFASGIADGLNQALQFRYDGFKRSFPGANDKFWNPAISWCNKYKNGDPDQGAKFPGSKTFLVFTTDAYHLTRFAEHLFAIGAVTIKISQEKKKWYFYIIDAAAYWLINRAGFALVYNRF